MKKLLLGLVTVVTIISSAQAGVFSAMSGMGMKEKKPLSSYTIDTAGINPRIYEFVPENDKTRLCVVIFTDKGIPAMQCFKRDGKQK